jgi:DNA-binding response OmpR family regulator
MRCGFGFNEGAVRPKRARILVVELPEIAKLVRCILEPKGYEASCASLPEAIERLRVPSPAIDLVVTGVPQLLQQPLPAPLLYLAPFPGAEPAAVRKRPGISVLIKPFSPSDLLQAVRSSLAMHPAGRRRQISGGGQSLMRDSS